MVLHACEDNVNHLGEGSLSSDLVVHVPGGKEDVVAGPHCQQHGALVDADILGGDDCQQRL